MSRRDSTRFNENRKVYTPVKNQYYTSLYQKKRPPFLHKESDL